MNELPLFGLGGNVLLVVILSLLFAEEAGAPLFFIAGDLLLAVGESQLLRGSSVRWCSFPPLSSPSSQVRWLVGSSSRDWGGTACSASLAGFTQAEFCSAQRGSCITPVGVPCSCPG